MEQPADEPRKSSAGRWIFLPTLLLLILVAGWSGFWYWAAGKTGEAVDVWLAREARSGRVYACGERHIGGYPFRIEVDCGSPSARIPVEGGVATASAPRLVALAQVYDPKQVIAELTGPVSLAGPDGMRADLSFTAARGSVRVEGRRFERGSVTLASPRLASGELELAAKAFEGHVRRTPDASAGTFDLAASLDAATSQAFDLLPLGSGPVSVELQAQANKLDDMRAGPLPERLKAFADAGGELKVALVKISRGDVAVEAKGDARLDAQGRVDGDFRVKARGVDEFVAMMVAGDVEDDVSSLLGLGAKMLGKKTEIDGQPATSYRLKIDRGRVSLGPIRLTRLPPAF